jgi:hypothetical protein
MSNIESSALRVHTTAAGSVGPNVGLAAPRGTSKARFAREFLIYLVSREIQLSGQVAGWLRVTARRLADQQLVEHSADCVQLAAGTWELREQLVALAHRLVARRNRGLGHRRINVMQLLEQPSSTGMLGFIEFNQQLISNAAPAVELAVVSAVEQLLVGVVPLAIDLAGFDDAANDDLVEVATCYEARFARAEALRRLTAAVVATSPAADLRETTDRAIECYTQILRESAEFAECLGDLDGRRGSLC